MKMESLTLGERIMLYRSRRDMSKKRLAQMVGISVSTLTRYEKGKSEPSSDMIYNLANSLNVSMQRLMYGFDDPKKDKIEPLIKRD